jgi:hypothetical protein
MVLRFVGERVHDCERAVRLRRLEPLRLRALDEPAELRGGALRRPAPIE